MFYQLILLFLVILKLFSSAKVSLKVGFVLIFGVEFDIEFELEVIEIKPVIEEFLIKEILIIELLKGEE